MSVSLNSHEKSHIVSAFNKEPGVEGVNRKDHCRRVSSDQDAAQRVIVDTAEGSSAGPPKYSIGTKVKKYFEGHGWFSGEVASHYDGHYLIVYEDGDSEEYNDQEMEDIVLTPDLADVDIGSRVAVYRPDDDKCYEATVTRLSPEQNKRRPLYLEYDDGDCEWLDLCQHKFRILSGGMRRRSEDYEIEENKRRRISQAERDVCEVSSLDIISESESGSFGHREKANNYNVIIVQSLVRRRASRTVAELNCQSATTIQAAWRGYCAYSRCQRDHHNIIIVQSLVRRQAARNVAEQKRWQLMDKSATAIQAAWRCYYGRSSYESKLLEIIVLQSIARGRAARNVVEQRRELMDQSATTIQAAWRCYCGRSSYESKLLDIIVLQSIVRGRAARKVAEQKRDFLDQSATTIQSAWKGYSSHSSYHRDRLHIIIVQSIVRGRAARNVAEQKRELIDQSATTIQSAWRGYSVFSSYQRALLDIIIVQSFVRCRAARIVAEQVQRHSATTIQTAWRGFYAVSSYQSDLMRIALVQCLVRCKAARNFVEQKRRQRMDRSATAIQTAWRGHYAYSSYQRVLLMIVQYFVHCREAEHKRRELMDQSVTAIQAAWRGYCAWSSYKFDILGVVIMQSLARRRAARNVTEQKRELIDQSASEIQTAWREVSSGHPPKYSIGTKVKKYFEGHGWFTGEIAAYDGEIYRVVYEDGDSEECDDQEMEDIVLTPDLAGVDVGSRVAVYRPDDDQCYEATVTRVRALRDQAERDACEVTILDTVSKSGSGSAVHQNKADNCNVVIVQSIMRRRAARNVAEQKRRQLMEKSATAIQATWRCYYGRLSYESKLIGFIVLQRIVRGRAARNVAEQKRDLNDQSATVIQIAWRDYCALSSYKSDQLNIIMVQSLVRRRAARIVAKQKRRELEEPESRFEQKLESLGSEKTAKNMKSKTVSTKYVEQQGELLEKSAEVSSGDPPKYSIGTIVKKYFEGHGWFTGEIAAYDGEIYRVVYEDGDSEECDDQEMEDIVLTPDLAGVDVGSRVAVYRPDDDQCYKATVTRVRVLRDRNNRRPLYLEYDDGDCGWLDLCQHKFRILKGGMHRRSEDHEAEDEAGHRADDGSSRKDLRDDDKVANGPNESEVGIASTLKISSFRRLTDQAEGDSRSQDVDDDDKDANESELVIASKLEASPFRPVEGNKRHRIDQAEGDSSNEDLDDDDKDANNANKSELGIASKLETSPFRIWNKRRRINHVESDSRSKGVGDEDANESELGIASKLETSRLRPDEGKKRRRIDQAEGDSRCEGVDDDNNEDLHDDDDKDDDDKDANNANKSELGITSKLKTSPFWIWNKRRRINQAQSDSSSKGMGDVEKDANESELCIASKLETSRLRPDEGNKRRRIDQAESDACEVARLDIVSESESGTSGHQHDCDEEPEVSFEQECQSLGSENTENMMKSKAASTDVAEHDEELLEKAAEMPQCDLLNHEEGDADEAFNVEQELQKLHESITMSGKDWDTDFMSVASESWDLNENLLDDAPIPLSEFHEKTESDISDFLERADPDIEEDDYIANLMVSRATMPPHFPLFFSGTSPDDVGEGQLVSPTMESAMGSPEAFDADETASPVFRCIPLQEPMLSMHLIMSGHSESDSLPGFSQLMNFPQYVRKKTRNGQKFCVMCGQARPVVRSRSQATAVPAMPCRSKGVCTACDMTAWNVVESNLVVKWCHGRCKHFLPLGAFGGHSMSMKTCVRCLEDQCTTERQNNAPPETPSRVAQSTVSLAPLKAAEESKTPETGAMTHSQPDHGNAQVHDNDVGTSLTDTKLTPCMYRCVPLEGPIPSGTPESIENTSLPDFWQLVNYPKYVTVGDKMQCTMCGELCHLKARKRGGKKAQVIPPRNKGICSACDMHAWQLVGSDLAIKFCYQCKKFHPCGAFGAEGTLRRCDKCRDYCREYHNSCRESKLPADQLTASPTPPKATGEPEMSDMELDAVTLNR